MESFYEKQKFNQWWIKLSIFIPFVIVFWGVITGKTQAENGSSMLVAAVVLGFISVLFYFANLETKIDTDGITGGFNFQAAWTTGFIAGKAAANAL